jgi:hypothetical protein
MIETLHAEHYGIYCFGKSHLRRTEERYVNSKEIPLNDINMPGRQLHP